MATITLKPFKQDNSIKAQLERQKNISNPFLRTATSLKTTAVLGSVLGTMLLPAGTIGGVVRGVASRTTLKGAGAVFLGAPVIGGLLLTAPQLLNPKSRFEFGKKIGNVFNDPKGTFENIKEDVSDFAKDKPIIATGLGAGAVLGAGGLAVAGGKNLIERFHTRELISGGTGGAVTSFQPLAPFQKPKEAPPLPMETLSPPPINIKNTFKPKIDISFKKSKRFINQQVIVR